MYVNLEVENFNFDICKMEIYLKIYVEIVTVKPISISWLRNEESVASNIGIKFRFLIPSQQQTLTCNQVRPTWRILCLADSLLLCKRMLLLTRNSLRGTAACRQIVILRVKERLITIK
jgi:hypothetical protein